MVNRNLLIGKVSPFLGKRDMLVGNQDTTDIIEALINNHYKYAKEYDKVYKFFEGDSVEETCYNVWKFLRDDFKYTIEPEEMQILRSPAAILASNIVGIDCKGFATWSAGVLDAVRRNTGKDFEVYYRFASYDPFDKTPQHVFCVVKENGTEYWIDPVLDQFNARKQPYYFKDKKIKNMALVAMSGIPQISANETSTMSNTNWFDSLLQAAPSIIKALPQNQPSYGGSYQSQNPYAGYNAPVQSTGISTNTILLIGAAGLAAYFIFKK
jgi:hypothetical protein